MKKKRTKRGSFTRDGFLLPEKVTLTTSRVSGKRFRFHYTESFLPRHTHILLATVKHMEPGFKSVGIKATVRGSTIHLKGIVPREVVGNAVMGEFLAWSSLGDITVRQLFIGANLGGIERIQKALESEQAP